MIDDDDVRLGGAAPRLEHEATLEVRALESRAQVRLGGHRVPHVVGRLVGQVRQAAVGAATRPRRYRLELGRRVGLEQRARRAARLLEPREAHVVPPALEQRERRRVLAGRERPRQRGEVLADQLLLEIDRVGRDDRALAVGARPRERGHQVGERLPHAGARFEQRHAAVVVGVGDVRGHVALAGAVLERAQRLCGRPARRQQAGDRHSIEARRRPRPRHLDHDVELGHLVVHDAEADAAVVQARRDGEVRARGLEHAAGVVVEEQLAALGNAREREHRVHGAAGGHARRHDRAVPVEPGDERHFTAVRPADLRAQQLANGRGEPLRTHVLSSRFLAAGNSTLLRTRR